MQGHTESPIPVCQSPDWRPSQGTAEPFAEKKGLCCTGARFSWKVSTMTAGKPSPEMLEKFASHFVSVAFLVG